MSRLALSDTDKQARDWFVETTKELGCNVTVDAMGNIFAVRPGLNNDKPPTFAGSHLDTQPTGGRYDGILGIHAGVEMLKVLNDNWVETQYPVGVVNWTKYVTPFSHFMKIWKSKGKPKLTRKKVKKELASQCPCAHQAYGPVLSPSKQRTTCEKCTRAQLPWPLNSLASGI